MKTKFLNFCGYAVTVLMCSAFFLWALFLAPLSLVM